MATTDEMQAQSANGAQDGVVIDIAISAEDFSGFVADGMKEQIISEIYGSSTNVNTLDVAVSLNGVTEIPAIHSSGIMVAVPIGLIVSAAATTQSTTISALNATVSRMAEILNSANIEINSLKSELAELRAAISGV